MGAWGAAIFQDDQALDWAFDLEETSDLKLVRDALAAMEPAAEAPDTSKCSAALAASEVVAALRGKPSATLPDHLAKWLAAHPGAPDPALVQSAARAVRRVEEKSKLQELWDASGGDEAKAWHGALQDLLTRLA